MPWASSGYEANATDDCQVVTFLWCLLCNPGLLLKKKEFVLNWPSSGPNLSDMSSYTKIEGKKIISCSSFSISIKISFYRIALCISWRYFEVAASCERNVKEIEKDTVDGEWRKSDLWNVVIGWSCD